MREKLSNVKIKISKTLFDTKMFLKNKGNKYQALFSLFGLLISVTAVVGISYAVWTDSAETGNNSISTGVISLRYVEDTSFATINNAEPMTANEAYQSNNYFPFQVVMQAGGEVELDYEVTITTKDTTTYSYDTDQKIRLGLKKENNIVTDGGFTLEGGSSNVDYTNGIIVGTLPTTGTSLTGNPQTIYKGKISVTNSQETVHSFKLYLWLDSNVEPNTVSEKYALTININTGDSNPNYQKYTLTYTDDEGVGCNIKQVRKNTPWGELCVPTVEDGYTFHGWYTGEDGTGTQITSTTVASSNQTVYAYYTSNTLYYVLKKASKVGTYARKYTGEHQDSMDPTKSTKDIYHWYGSNNTNGTAILDKNNVIFANHCWQMLRTTDTGGVRMIYNGEVVDGKCINTRGNHVGYGGSRSSQSLNGTYWYGTDYTYDSSNNVFSIGGTTSSTQVTSSNGSTVIPTLVGKYTCKSTTESGTCSTLYLIESYNSSYNAYAIPLNSSSRYSQFGRIQFNANSDSLAYVGYMYNTVYIFNSIRSLFEPMFSVGLPLSTTYYYADSYDYNETNVNKYTLTNPYQVSSTSDYSSLVGKYTFRNTSSTYSSTEIFYIVAVNGTSMYYIKLSDGNNLSHYNDTYTYGDSYTDNGNGTYTISNPTTINKTEYYNNYNDMKNKYVCKNATNNTCGDVWRTTSNVSTTTIEHLKSSNTYKFSSEFTYNNTNHKYTLNSDSVTFWDTTDSNNVTSLKTHHYTCFNTTGECEYISYVYSVSSDIYYINISNGKSVEDALNEMLTDNSVNTKNSTIKTGIDAWYKKYILPYDSYIDDTIYCNDRSIKSLGAWNATNGNVTNSSSNYLQFKEYTATSNLSCSNITDRFSVTNNSARLTYKVGLITSPEMNLLNNNNARKTGGTCRLLSPKYVNSEDSIFGYMINTAGGIAEYSLMNNSGVRPTVSLIPGMRYSSGDGSMANPYVVDVGN